MSINDLTSFKSSAPANTMLMGEHSVVYGQPALVAALTPRIEIEWLPRSDQQIEIQSALAHYLSPINPLNPHPNLRFIIETIRLFSTQLQHGWTLKVHSEFPADWGLGSSAAVLAATLIGLENITNQTLTPWQRFKLGHSIILKIQGRGSGADLAASLMGGCVYFDPINQTLKSLPVEQTLSLVYSGYKTPTAEVLNWVAEQWKDRPNGLQQLYQDMGAITRKSYQALSEQNWPQFYQQVAQYQQYMVELGVSDPRLDQLCEAVNQQLPAAKISGSGLGDCIIGFGQLDNFEQAPLLKTKISPIGALCTQMEKPSC
ncbi:GHMP kinase [Thiomicrospira microaerophila]|uniref:mevalonate kinase family protein n=1 Tax=Thiomicrospira microaerophila TaxID=406020 RepID=UPI002010AD3F|nr:GHMP kinase [Thiomicrospira microaerophila]UQB42821.1 GHMP kinase [Thiomicrospira microaerophila]